MQGAPQPQPQAVQPIIIHTTAQQQWNGGNAKYEKLQSKAIVILGVIQLSLGILCLIANIVGILIHASITEIGHGIWCGIFFIISGAFGIMAGKSKTLCSIVTYMVLSIMAAVMTTPLLIIAAIGLAEDDNVNYRYRYYRYEDYDSFYSGEKVAGRKAMQAILVTAALAEAIIAIVSSALCCQAVCCCRQRAVLSYPGQTVQYITHPNGTQGQVIVIQNTGQLPQQNLVYAQAGPANPQFGTSSNPGYPVGTQPPSQFQQQPNHFPQAQPPVYSSAPPPDYAAKQPLPNTQI